jgi:hypothetical protein
MGRPINKKFFANTNAPYQDQATGGPTGQGGESVASVALGTAGTGYSQGVTLTTTAPQLPNGVQATFTVAVSTVTGAVTSYTVVEGGSGYTTTPSVTLNVPDAVTKAGTTGTTATTVIYVTNTNGIYLGMEISGGATGLGGKVVSIGALSGGSYPISSTVANDDTFTAADVTFTDIGASAVPGTVTMTSTQQNGITVYAFVPGGSSGVIGDIMKQEASRRYLVKTAQGQGQCILVTTSTLTAGQMYMTAVDVTGASYFVDKLTARRARLYRYAENAGTFEFADGDVSGWSLAAATTGTVQIVNS